MAERRERATRHMAKRQKQGLTVQPVEIKGRKIARTFWGDSWCQHLESFSDYENRLPRGRTYVRNGSVCHLEIASGEIRALVSGSELYDVHIEIGTLPRAKWSAVKQRCSGKIGSLLELLQGKLSSSVMSIVTHRQEGLFPLPSEISMQCSCPDWAVMCKHVAAVLYGVGARLDDQPELLFVLRGVDHKELIEADAATLVSKDRQGSSRRIAEGDLEDVFGIEMVRQKAPSHGSRRAERGDASPGNGVPERAVQQKKKNGPGRRSGATAAVEDGTLTGKAVKELRLRLDMSYNQLATLLGVSAASVRNWEQVKGRLNLQARTAKALNTARKLSRSQAWRKLEKV
ncbi:MAG TPA: SWIM zinc finger family protein [Candidatus Obscuribacterales bacterium]